MTLLYHALAMFQPTFEYPRLDLEVRIGDLERGPVESWNRIFRPFTGLVLVPALSKCGASPWHDKKRGWDMVILYFSHELRTRQCSDDHFLTTTFSTREKYRGVLISVHCDVLWWILNPNATK